MSKKAKSPQPEVNIGMVGHVDHGKTSLTEALSGRWTDTHSEELKKGISIKLGYADTTFYKCPKCKPPECYTTEKKCPQCKAETEYLRKVSFVDSPGHETLMATMLSGAAIMNGALLLIAANEKCPQPQSREHLTALEVSQIKNIIIVQNKIDLVDEEQLKENYKQIRKFVKGTIAEKAAIIPISAHHNANIDILIQAIQEFIPTPKLEDKDSPRMYIARSFDINKPGTTASRLNGGVIGGTLLQGSLKKDDTIEIQPGRRVDESGKVTWEPIQTTITTLQAGGETYEEVKPGGLIGIGTTLDPAFTKSDGLIGRVVGEPGALPPLWDKFTMETHLLDHAVGKTDLDTVEEIRTREPLMLNVGTATTVGVVSSARKENAEVTLKRPICAEKGQRIAISRKMGGKWHLIGYGVISK